MYAIGQLLLFLLQAYFYVIIAQVVISWLVVFDVINIRKKPVENLVRLLVKLTDPVLTPVRKIIPPIGGIDLSPLVVIFAIFILQGLVRSMFLY